MVIGQKVFFQFFDFGNKGHLSSVELLFFIETLKKCLSVTFLFSPETNELYDNIESATFTKRFSEVLLGSLPPDNSYSSTSHLPSLKISLSDFEYMLSNCPHFSQLCAFIDNNRHTSVSSLVPAPIAALRDVSRNVEYSLADLEGQMDLCLKEIEILADEKDKFLKLVDNQQKNKIMEIFDDEHQNHISSENLSSSPVLDVVDLSVSNAHIQKLNTIFPALMEQSSLLTRSFNTARQNLVFVQDVLASVSDIALLGSPSKLLECEHKLRTAITLQETIALKLNDLEERKQTIRGMIIRASPDEMTIKRSTARSPDHANLNNYQGGSKSESKFTNQRHLARGSDTSLFNNLPASSSTRVLRDPSNQRGLRPESVIDEKFLPKENHLRQDILNSKSRVQDTSMQRHYKSNSVASTNADNSMFAALKISRGSNWANLSPPGQENGEDVQKEILMGPNNSP